MRDGGDQRILWRHGAFMAIGSSTTGSLGLDSAVVHIRGTASGCPSRNPRNAHRRQGATHDSLDTGNETVHARGQESLAQFEAQDPEQCDQHENSNALDHAHRPPVVLLIIKLLGNSSKSRRSPALTFLAFAGTLNEKGSDTSAAPVFQVLSSMLYCGALFTCVLVTT